MFAIVLCWFNVSRAVRTLIIDWWEILWCIKFFTSDHLYKISDDTKWQPTTFVNNPLEKFFHKQKGENSSDKNQSDDRVQTYFLISPKKKTFFLWKKVEGTEKAPRSELKNKGRGNWNFQAGAQRPATSAGNFLITREKSSAKFNLLSSTFFFHPWHPSKWPSLRVYADCIIVWVFNKSTSPGS